MAQKIAVFLITVLFAAGISPNMAHAASNHAHMAECRELFLSSFPIEKLDALLGTKLQLQVEHSHNNCVFSFASEGGNENVLLIDFSPREESIAIYEWSRKNVTHPLVAAEHFPGVIYGFSYKKFGMNVVEVLTADYDWITVCVSTKKPEDVSYQVAKLSMDFVQTPQMRAWVVR
ncbi:hypothetical protein GJV26_25940 [Massilia dura]|uniref:Secreted protein n=1 Tax=Pseudoduganella dura TaxID=321982 RepID=A0A6I3XG11_9BURK|nr:hypothetical protein [Pseudoduganella dura]MUI15874.1 hypothetical protein [Pseudoduganella dura]GGX89973.1 hypothetical protein GCM10007386_21090 [Pseudoduganella dura]